PARLCRIYRAGNSVYQEPLVRLFQHTSSALSQSPTKRCGGFGRRGRGICGFHDSVQPGPQLLARDRVGNEVRKVARGGLRSKERRLEVVARLQFATVLARYFAEIILGS